jgi:hypothetical protein
MQRFFSTKFCVFHTQHKKCHFLLKQLYGNIECRSKCEIFVNFLKHFKLCLNRFQNPGACAPRCQNTLPLYIEHRIIF